MNEECNQRLIVVMHRAESLSLFLILPWPHMMHDSLDFVELGTLLPGALLVEAIMIFTWSLIYGVSQPLLTWPSQPAISATRPLRRLPPRLAPLFCL